MKVVVVKFSGNRKNKSEYGICDKDMLTPPSIKIYPLFDEAKKGDSFNPLPPVWTNVPISAIFFLKASLNERQTYLQLCLYQSHLDHN